MSRPKIDDAFHQRVDRIEKDVVTLQQQQQEWSTKLTTNYLKVDEFEHLSSIVTNLTSRLEQAEKTLTTKEDRSQGEQLRDDLRALDEVVAEKGDHAALRDCRKDVNHLQNQMATRAERDSMEKLSQKVYELSTEVQQKETKRRVEELSEVIGTVKADLDTKAAISKLTNLVFQMDGLEHTMKTKAAAAKVSDLERQVALHTREIQQRASNNAHLTLQRAVEETTVFLKSKADEESMTILKHELDKTQLDLLKMAPKESLQRVETRLQEVQTDMHFKATAKDFTKLLRRMEEQEMLLKKKADQEEHQTLKERVAADEAEMRTKAQQSEYAQVRERVSVIEGILPTKADSWTLDVLRQKVSSLGQDLAAKAYEQELRAYKAFLSRLANEVEDKCDREDLNLLQERVLQNRSRIHAEATERTRMFNEVKNQTQHICDLLHEKPDFSHLPVAPNLLKDSKLFEGLCKGLRDTPMDWDRGGMGGDWLGGTDRLDNPGNKALVDCSCRVEVVDMGNFKRCTDLGLYPFGDLEAFLVDSRGKESGRVDGAELSACILDISIKEDAEGQGIVSMLTQGRTPKYTSWNSGANATEVSVFVNVLEAAGDIKYHLFAGRSAGVTASSELQGKGWRHLYNFRQGFGGEELSYFAHTGSMRIAVALPYVGSGFHGGVPIWSGYISDCYATDTRVVVVKPESAVTGRQGRPEKPELRRTMKPPPR